MVNQGIQGRTNIGTSVIEVGSTFTYKDPVGKLCTYTIVSEKEMDVQRGKISATSPLATAVLGKSVGEKTTVKASRGEYQIEILASA